VSELKLLGPDDEEGLVEFLEEHIDSSLILLSNLETAGLEDHGQRRQGTYIASFASGKIAAVAAHFWNGIVIVQGDIGLEDAARAAMDRSGRSLNGIIGPLPLVERARRALGAESRRAIKEDPEILYALDLDCLRVPPLLSDSSVTCRAPNPDESAGLLVDWRVDYSVETLGEQRTPALRQRSSETLAALGRLGWVLLHHDQPVAYSTFNASTHGVVQVGGVFTPAHLRGRGYGRAVVGKSLLDARNDGMRRSILFTSRTNLAAQRAYAALGYEAIGDFGLVLFGGG
jgi:RimJ/RimL family protein N-acetyltransferase